jgi:mannonate dehydratase
MEPLALHRRNFIGGVLAGAAAAALAPGRAVAVPAAPPLPPLRLQVGHQHDHSADTLRLLAALGVEHICSGIPSPRLDAEWSVDGLTRLRRHVESFGVRLDAVPLPLASSPIAKADYPEILLAHEPARARALDDICQMIRNAGAAGIPLVKYNLTFLGVVRTGRIPGRGGASDSAFDYAQSGAAGPMTAAGAVTAEIYWDRITHFLRRVVPVAEEAKVRLALHPGDPGLPADRDYQGVHAVLNTVDGLKRFIATVPSANHGLNFCQGTISEMLPRPGEQIYEVIRYFGQRGKIFNVHFRNIAGGFLQFSETFPDNGAVDMPRALRTYREVGFAGMVMPDHVPVVAGDTGGLRAFSYCFGYIQALLQGLRNEA